MIKITLTLLCALFLSACSKNEVPEEMTNWCIGYTMPSLYPVKVGRAYGENIKEKWKSSVHNHSQFMTNTELTRNKKIIPSYDGFGLPVGSGFFANYSQPRHTNHLPDKIVIAWTSLYNSKFYITEFNVTPEIKKRMYTKQNKTYNSKLFCYQQDFDFGFMPNGQVKVWIGGCGGRYTYVTELAPRATPDTDSMGSNAAVYDSSFYKETLAKRAKDANVTTMPLPLDKINQVFPAEDAIMNTLGDKIPASALWVEKSK